MTSEYRTPAAPADASFIEKKSEFIGYISPCKNEQQALDFINEIRKLHRKATHNCYAYILRDNNISRHSDDGEPSGTAGAPIYEVLRREGLTDVCCVVTRYFGGILLGAGGLVRAYANAAKLAVDSAVIREMAVARRLKLSVDYSLYGKMGALFSAFEVKLQREDFSSSVELELCVREEKSGEFRSQLVDLCCGRVEIEDMGTEERDFS